MLCHWCRLTSINSMSSIPRSIFSTLYCSFEMIFTVVPSSGDFCWEPVCRTHTTHTFQGSLTLITDITFKNDLVKAADVLNGLGKKHGMPLERGTHLLTHESVPLWFYSAECKINSRWWEILYTTIKHRECNVRDRKVNHCFTFGTKCNSAVMFLKILQVKMQKPPVVKHFNFRSLLQSSSLSVFSPRK